MADGYDVGDGIRVTATFKDFDGGIFDPTIVVFKLKDPTGAETTPTVHQVDTGVYYADFVVDRRGIWCYRWHGKGLVQAASEGSISVRASKFS